MFAFLQNLGGPELILILVIVLLVVGASRLPQLARSLGQSATELRKGMEEGLEDDEDESAESKAESLRN